MNKNNGVSRFAERAGWCVTILTFFGGTIFLQLRQEAHHQNQILKLQNQAESFFKRSAVDVHEKEVFY